MASVLIVDDQPDISRVLARLFQSDGHAADVASCGEEALAKLAVELPSVVLLDVMMPGVDGLEVLRQIRADPQTAAVPVVMYSAVSDPALGDHARRKGANGYVVKGRGGFPDLLAALAPYLTKQG